MELPHSAWKEFLASRDEPAWFTDYRKKAFELLRSAPLPDFKYGLSIRIQPDFDFASLKPGESAVTRTGHPAASSSFPEHASKGFKEFFDTFEAEKHALFFMHQAYANHFLLLDIAQTPEEPIEIGMDLEKGPVWATLLIRAQKGVEAKIVITKSGSLEKGFVSDDIRVIAEPGSKVDVITIQDLPKDCTVIQRRVSRAGKQAKVNWVDICFGSLYLKSDILSQLIGEGADSRITVLFNADHQQKQDIYTASHHIAPHTTSDIVTKGVVNGQAKALSRGLVKIGERANGSNGYEKQDVLLLSEDGEADAIPNLEIHNNDVKCSHGSTIGQVDTEKLFYLMSRGLSRQQAVRKIVEGYFAPVLDLFPDHQTRQRLEQSLSRLLEAAA